ncbi:hypothetical protein K8353_44385, partial [Burkholderia contaminans]|nr:hypothetical protein [Burkholderia contaminans]
MIKKDIPQAYDLLTKANNPRLNVKTGIHVEEIENPSFVPMLNGTATNNLAIIGRYAEPTRINP